MRVPRLPERPATVIAVALAIRLGTIVLLLSTQILPRNGWYFPNEDQTRYFDFARKLAHWGIMPSVATIGYDALLLPFAAVTTFVLQALPFVAVVQALLALPAAALLYRAGTRVLDRQAALLGTAIWLVLPALGLLWIPVDRGPSAEWAGLRVAVEYPSALLAIGVLAVAAGARTDGGVLRGALVGVLGGTAMLVKPPNAVVLGCALLALLVWRRFAAAGAACVTAVVMFAPQLVFNHRLFGSITSFAYNPSIARRYLPSHASLAGGTWSPRNLPRAYGRLIVHNATGPLVLIALAAALVLTWRRYPAARWLVVAQVVAFGVLFGVYRYGTGNDLMRYLEPALPAASLAAGAGLVRGSDIVTVRVRPARWPAAVAIAASLGAAIALCVAVAVAPRRTDLIRASTATAAVEGPRVRLRWSEPWSGSHLTYVVLRSRGPGPRNEEVVRGFHWIALPAGESFPAPTTSYVDRPPPGTWWYRVLIAPGLTPSGSPPGPTVGVSNPVRVVVGP
jgi:hypothetical protein